MNVQVRVTQQKIHGLKGLIVDVVMLLFYLKLTFFGNVAFSVCR